MTSDCIEVLMGDQPRQYDTSSDEDIVRVSNSRRFCPTYTETLLLHVPVLNLLWEID